MPFVPSEEETNILIFLAQHGPYPLSPSWGPAWNPYRRLENRGYIEATGYHPSCTYYRVTSVGRCNAEKRPAPTSERASSDRH